MINLKSISTNTDLKGVKVSHANLPKP